MALAGDKPLSSYFDAEARGNVTVAPAPTKHVDYLCPYGKTMKRRAAYLSTVDIAVESRSRLDTSSSRSFTLPLADRPDRSSRA